MSIDDQTFAPPQSSNGMASTPGRRVRIRTEPLPLTAAGKIQKNVLRAPFWEGYTRRVS